MRRVHARSAALDITEVLQQSQLVDPPSDPEVDTLESLLAEASRDELRHDIDAARALVPYASAFLLSGSWSLVCPLIHLFVSLCGDHPDFREIVREMGKQLIMIFDCFREGERPEVLTCLRGIASADELAIFCAGRLQRHEELAYGERVAILGMFADLVEIQV